MDRSKACRVSHVTVKVNKEDRDSHALTEGSPSVPIITRRISRQAQPQSQERGLISLKGLLTAQKFSKGLKERAAQKLAAKRGVRGPARKPIPIINDQVPTGCAQPKERFPVAHVTQLVQDFLASRLEGVCYTTGLSVGPLVLALSAELKGLVRNVCPTRYRLVCIVNLGPVGQKGLMLASRCLWDAHADTCISHTTQTAQVFCTASVFAVYNE